VFSGYLKCCGLQVQASCGVKHWLTFFICYLLLVVSYFTSLEFAPQYWFDTGTCVASAVNSYNSIPDSPEDNATATKRNQFYTALLKDKTLPYGEIMSVITLRIVNNHSLR
jgi:hypothetical protein